MDFYTLISQRRSIRSYRPDKPVPQEVMERIISAGIVAPTAANRQPWRAIVVESEDMLHEVRECYHRDWFKRAPQIVVVVGDKDVAWRRGDGYNAVETDVTIVMDHMILAAEYEGVGTCWIAAFDTATLYNALNLAENEVVYAVTPMGYPEEGWSPKPGPIRRSINEVVTFL
ncbi:MAG: nitroreductase family protein [Fibrobacterales bacterium]